MRRVLRVPLAVAAVARSCCCVAFTNAADSIRPRSPCSSSSRSCSRSVGQEFWRGGQRARIGVRRAAARRRRQAGAAQPAPLRRLPRARGDRDPVPRRGGLVGLRPPEATCACGRAEHARSDGYTITYRKATAGIVGDRAGTGAPITLGAVLDVRKGKQALHAQPVAQLLLDPGPLARGRSGASSTGEANSDVAMRWGLGADFWTAIQPDLSKLNGPIAVADQQVRATSPPNVQGAGDRRDHRSAT